MAVPRNISDEKLIQVCSTFLAGHTATETAKICNEIWRSQGSDFQITREQVYPLLARGRDRRFISLAPPMHEILGEQIARRYGHEQGDIKVVQVARDLDTVASATARIILKHIQILGVKKQILGAKKRGKQRVHVGLGAGRTTMMVAQQLAAGVRTEPQLPALTLHAISSGFDVAEPQKAAVSFFSYFENTIHDIEYVGFFAPAVVKWNRYEEVKKMAGAREAFAAKHDIDIVITSLASRRDKHGDLNRFMEVAPNQGLTRQGWIGDVQYCPYAESGPIKMRSGDRAVTLFELEELRELAKRKDKYVVLVSGPCGKCGRTRSDALKPLVENPKLKVWTQLVLDLDTAKELVPAPSA